TGDEPAHPDVRGRDAVRCVPDGLSGGGGGREGGAPRLRRRRADLGARLACVVARSRSRIAARDATGGRIGDVTRVRVGTSGWNHTEWKGSFYPADLKPAAMLPYYAERFSTVEVNATFYRIPTPKVVAGWAAAAGQRRARHRRGRGRNHARPRHCGLGVFPPPRRRLHRRAAWGMGEDDPHRRGRLGRRVRVLQARGTWHGARARSAARNLARDLIPSQPTKEGAMLDLLIRNGQVVT